MTRLTEPVGMACAPGAGGDAETTDVEHMRPGTIDGGRTTPGQRIVALARDDVGRTDAASFRTAGGTSWCMYFVSSLLERCGLDAPGRKEPARRGAKAGLHWIAGRGQWVLSPIEASILMRRQSLDDWQNLAARLRPGDVVAWRASLLRGDWRGHIAIVEKVTLHTGPMPLVHSIGGNEGPRPGEVRQTVQTIRQWARKRPGGLLGVARYLLVDE